MEPWIEDRSYAAGWLAGLLDGEGCLYQHPNGAYRLSVSQKEGLVLDRLRLELASRGLRYTETLAHGVTTLTIRDGWRKILPLLGAVRPTRLLHKFDPDCVGQMRSSVSRPTLFRVEAIEPAGLKDVVTLSTTTATYLTEGFGSHNTARGNLALHSNRLQGMSEALGCPKSKTAVRADVWRRAQRGDREAFAYVVEHCKLDVEILDWAYGLLRPYVRQHPPLTERPNACRVCASESWEGKGLRFRLGASQRRFRCNGCGAYTYMNTKGKQVVP